MTVGFFVSRAQEEVDDGSAAFFDAYASVRRFYRDVQDWTGLDADQLLAGELPEHHATRNAALAIRSIAGQLAVHDVLGEAGVRPDAILALSLGITSASCMVGSLSREQMFRMLWHRRRIPDLPAGEPAQGVALCIEQPGQDRTRFYQGRDDVYLAVDFGRVSDGSRWAVLTGYKAALQELAAQEPEAIMVMERGTAAVHSPLRRHASDFVRAHVETLDVKDPLVPLAACLGPHALTTADEVREAIWRNLVVTASIPDGLAATTALGVTVLVVPGPSMADNMVEFPVPVVRVKVPGDVAEAVDAVREALG
ncbi:acyltransferase domain-containing protein [Pseudofrankia inefficax]|uniref:Acyl transferase n=1 Tax=Pseudofrankia inefficax (strain DSM 45817 / CECT 9037 / DDB 130130 / EuI1c) TaxID=298654 RepID=E3JBV1_PSEI1|nr:acyltransferase domain-containing protein [Pseudofrankia inefficax]ADP82261.1 Acyl transferase [Pseudofrankia inefficax]